MPAPTPAFPAPRSATRWRRYAAVAVGGFLGALSRYGLGLLVLPTAAPSWGLSPAEWVTASINTVGALMLGLLTGLWAAGRGPGSRTAWVRAGLGPGFLGAFTTFSALALTSVHPLRPLEVLAQVLLGLIAAGLGLFLGRAITRGPSPRAGTP